MALGALLESSFAVAPSPFYPLAILVPLLLLYRSLSRHQLTEPSVPRAGVSRWPFSGLLASIKATYDFPHVLEQAHDQYTSANQPCIISNLVTGPMLLLPRCYHKWMIAQPDHVLDRHSAQQELVAVQELLWYAATPFEATLHGKEPLKWLAARVDEAQDDVVQEIKDGFLEAWDSHDQGWKEVKVYETLLAVVNRISWQLVAGKDLGQRKELWRYGQYTIMSCFVIGRLSTVLPRCLRRRGALTMGFAVRLLFWRIRAILLPSLRAHMADLNAGREGLDSTDFLSWAVAHERQTRGITVMDDETVNRLCSMAMQMIFATTHNVAMTLSNTLLLLLRRPSDRGYIATLRAEAEAAAAGPGPHTWTKQRIAQLRGLDSALRESMRLVPISMVMPIWRVNQDVILPVVVDGSSGMAMACSLTLRKGTKVSLPAYGVQVDEKEYHDALEYDALRFVESASPLTTPSSSFMAWSVGRTACPGRHWAAMTMKLMLAVVVSEYEVASVSRCGEMEGRAAEAMRVWRAGPIEIPDIASMLKVKRRAVLATS